MGHIINIHGSNMYHYLNTVKIIKSIAKDAGTANDASEINANNIINITEDLLNDDQKQ